MFPNGVAVIVVVVFVVLLLAMMDPLLGSLRPRILGKVPCPCLVVAVVWLLLVLLLILPNFIVIAIDCGCAIISLPLAGWFRLDFLARLVLFLSLVSC